VTKIQVQVFYVAKLCTVVATNVPGKLTASIFRVKWRDSFSTADIIQHRKKSEYSYEWWINKTETSSRCLCPWTSIIPEFVSFGSTKEMQKNTKTCL